MNIRKAKEDDAAAIAAVAIAVWIDAYADNGMDLAYSRYVLNRFTEANLLEILASKYVYVAETEFGICGFAAVSPGRNSDYEIETMYILNRFHSNGVGANLLSFITDSFAGQFWLKCAEYNPRALSFYRRHGFVDSGYVNFTLDGKEYPCVVLKRIT